MIEYTPETLPDISDDAQNIRKLIRALFLAEDNLAGVKDRVPSYTGHLRSEDYWAQEEGECRVLASELEKMLKNLIHNTVSRSEEDCAVK